jgi:hypothetical protein
MARLPSKLRRKKSKKKLVGTAALLLGAAGLALYIVGVKGRYRLDDERAAGEPGDASAAEGDTTQDRTGAAD